MFIVLWNWGLLSCWLGCVGFFVGFLCQIRLGTFANFIVFIIMFWRSFLKNASVLRSHRKWKKETEISSNQSSKNLKMHQTVLWKKSVLFFFFSKILLKKKFYILKVHIFWEGDKILQNLHQIFDWQYIGQIIGGDFAKVFGLLRIYELY